MDVSRFSGCKELNLDVKFVTPAFLGGADSKKAELRAASFKGMLRFWWRALYGTQYGTKILEEENNIFGSAASGKSNASYVRLLVQGSPSEKDSNDLIKNPNSILSYLAYGKGSTREDRTFATYLDTAGTPFKISVSLSSKLSEVQAKQAKNALLALLEFGGVGGKNRNGFGCMKLLNPSMQMERLRLSCDAQEFPALSRQSRCFETKKSFSSCSEALGEIGSFYKKCKQAKAMKLCSLPGEKRHSKEMFLHVTQGNDDKFRGRFLTMPLSGSNFSMFYEELKNFEDITNTFFEV